MTLGTVLLVLVFVVFLFMMMKKGGGCCGGHGLQEPKKGGGCCDANVPQKSHDHHNELESGSIDPVCGMAVDEKSGLASEHQGKHYAFCSEHCRKSFDADPGKYV
ncbi:MAG: YHS domain-containing protein [Thermodesulfobacteriota bacterium]